jgi:hypothetical protein
MLSPAPERFDVHDGGRSVAAAMSFPFDAYAFVLRPHFAERTHDRIARLSIPD